jgi:hypothetical protein
MVWIVGMADKDDSKKKKDEDKSSVPKARPQGTIQTDAVVDMFFFLLACTNAIVCTVSNDCV